MASQIPLFQPMPGEPKRIFICYAKEDVKALADLENHLTPLKALNVITVWSAELLVAGQRWNSEIQAELAQADLVVILVSANLLSSKYAVHEELEPCLTRNAQSQDGPPKIIGVIIRSVADSFMRSTLGDLQLLPKGLKPVLEDGNRDRAWAGVVNGIEAAIASVAPVPQNKPADDSPADREHLDGVAGVLSWLPDAVPNEVAISLGRQGALEASPGAPQPASAEARAAAFQVYEKLLLFIKQHEGAPDGYGQLGNLLLLGCLCADDHPSEIVHLFSAVEELAKDYGDKHAVHMAAEATIRAFNSLDPPISDWLTEKAKALVCGIGWSLQRVGRLAQASAATEDALHLARSVNDRKTVAFCKKCLGRLRRMQAEAQPSHAKCYLAESESLLKEAIVDFGALPDELEVGDCYSLLGRTYLVGGQNNASMLAVVQAEDRLEVAKGKKDWADLLILKGELAERIDTEEAALQYYVSAAKIAASTKAPWSEIRARAERRRGLLLGKQGHSTAKRRLESAASTYFELGERETGSEVLLELRRFEKKLPSGFDKAMQGSSARAGVAALDVIQRVESRSRYTNPRRAAFTPEQWGRIRAEAEAEVAVQHDWFEDL